jgi:hypothetical protein
MVSVDPRQRGSTTTVHTPLTTPARSPLLLSCIWSFCDRGTLSRPSIFYIDSEQRKDLNEEINSLSAD